MSNDKILFVVNKATNELDFILPLMWKIKQQTDYEINVLYTVVNKRHILREAGFYSRIMLELNVKEYDFNDFTQGMFGKFLSVVNNLYTSSIADTQHFTLYKSYDESRLLKTIRYLLSLKLVKKHFFMQMRKMQTDCVDLHLISQVLEPKVVFFAYRSYKFYRRDDFIDLLFHQNLKLILYPHGPFISNGYEKIAPLSNREKDKESPLPDFCHYWFACKEEFTHLKYPKIDKRITWSGYPGLDSDWLCYLKNKFNHRKNNDSQIRILFIIRKFAKFGGEQDYGVLQYDEFHEILNEVIRVTQDSSLDIRLVIKPHPHNDYKGISEIVDPYDNIEVTYEPNYYEIVKSDLVIGFPSTSLLIPLFYGIPVVLLNCSVLDQFKNEWPFMHDLFGGYQYYVQKPDCFEDVFNRALLHDKSDSCTKDKNNTEIQFFREIYPDGSLDICLKQLDAVMS